MHRLFSALLPGILLLSTALPGQEESAADEQQPTVTLPVGLPVKLDISRRTLNNFLTDETALLPYRAADDSIINFTGAFTIGSPSAPFAPIWDPRSCRLVGVLDLESSGADPTYRLLASGQIPTSTISGANGSPAYFGMRLDRGRPEFLYTHGAHAIAEMIWLEDEGTIMKQRLSFRKPLKSLKLTIPEAWLPFITPSIGELDEGTLSASGEEISEVTLLYRLKPPVDSGETSEGSGEE